jgi:hypothetical protein
VDTEDAAAALIRRLDSDRDGEISTDSLERFLDRYAERLAKAEARAAEDDAGAPPVASAASAGAPGKKGSKAAAAAAAGHESDGAIGLSSDSESEAHGGKPRAGGRA